MSPWSVLLRVELPLAWPGIATAAVLSFAHTLGEFGVVLMVGGSIPGETRTVAIAIYDRVQAFDEGGGSHVGGAARRFHGRPRPHEHPLAPRRETHRGCLTAAQSRPRLSPA
ncbi:molybdate ABC transporter permease subunit [Pseudoroseomonas wenyumeiae]